LAFQESLKALEEKRFSEAEDKLKRDDR